MKKTYALLVLLISTGFCFINPVSAPETAPTSTVTSRVVEDGGAGPFKAIMVSESSLPTHTVFKPSDLSATVQIVVLMSKDFNAFVAWPWQYRQPSRSSLFSNGWMDLLSG